MAGKERNMLPVFRVPVEFYPKIEKKRFETSQINRSMQRNKNIAFKLQRPNQSN